MTLPPLPPCAAGAAAVLAVVMSALPAAAAVTAEQAAGVFSEARTICERDAGRFWGHTLCGPILLVDPTDRTVTANTADAGGVLKPTGPWFTGVLPDSEIVANTPIEWSGTRWTELMWPLPEDVMKRHAMLAHEMFHRIQPELGLMRPEGGNQHLDTLEGRYLLQLEWRALAAALRARDPAARTAAARDALAFRRERYRLFPAAAAEEAALEIDEGVPEYTGVMIGLETPQERTAYALRDLTAFVDAPTFVRSFAYATGPAYGLLLDEAAPGWRGRLGSGQRLDEMLAAGLGVPASAAADVKRRATAYDDGTLRSAEVKREAARQARLTALKAKLVDGPVLVLPLPHVSYQFNPQTLQPLGEFGTVYPSIRLSSDWGVLEVDDGALLDKEMKMARVSAVGISASGVEGKGWRLTLKPGWVARPGGRNGDWIVAPTER